MASEAEEKIQLPSEDTSTLSKTSFVSIFKRARINMGQDEKALTCEAEELQEQTAGQQTHKVSGPLWALAGIQLLPYVVFNVTTAMANGLGMSKKSYYMLWYIFAGSLCLVGSALMYTVDEFTSSAKIWGYTILLGVGCGVFVQSSFTVSQAKVRKSEIPLAIGYCTFVQLAGPAIALCIANAAFLNEAVQGIQEQAPQLPIEAIKAAISGASSRRIEGISDELQQSILHIIVKAMSKVYILPMAAGALTVTMGFFMKTERLNLGGH
ncbi:hypothetical protein G7Y89_g4614 [Cudoniella acicularis]|uniref:Uncharacterized protein n=1 Tax=Cudoniella acicularis TaxID=354080 RepID=A0A8H4RR94_9HELO|nr:hypothetical protein G7Y89_g4614 [Cudoniella acicularis]